MQHKTYGKSHLNPLPPRLFALTGFLKAYPWTKLIAFKEETEDTPEDQDECPVDDTNTGLCYEQTDAEFVVTACPDGAWDPNADDGKGGTGAWVVPEEIYYCRPSDPAKPTFDKSEWFATEVQQGRLLTCPEVVSYMDGTPIYPGEDQWVACTVVGGGRDWIQVGDLHHAAGSSHESYSGYPSWGDDEA